MNQELRAPPNDGLDKFRRISLNFDAEIDQNVHLLGHKLREPAKLPEYEFKGY